jgi:Uma2 family endonuclease
MATCLARRYSQREVDMLRQAGIVAQDDPLRLIDGVLLVDRHDGPYPLGLSTGDVQRMVDIGLLTSADRVELLDGTLYTMSPVGDPYSGCVDYLANALVAALVSRVIVRVQSPITLGPASRPQPDLALLVPRPDFYRSRPPEASDLLLIIEVMATSQYLDRGLKLPIYARAEVPEVWLVDLAEEVVEVYRDSDGHLYRNAFSISRGGHVSPMAFPDLSLSVADILGD